MNRIVVVGTSGSGKTSLAKKLSAKLDLSHVELDALYWLPEWTPRPIEEFEHLVAQKTSGEKWIVCGNYSHVRQDLLAKADTVIWIDYPLWRCFWQTLKRSLQRIIKKEQCCNGNYETFGRTFFSRESILWWVITSHKKRKKEYGDLMKDSKYEKTYFIRLASPKEMKKLLESM